MSLEVALRIKDGLLCSALKILISELGYKAVESGDAPMLTDDASFFDQHRKVLYVFDEKPDKTEVNYIVRPFSKEELADALNVLFDDARVQSNRLNELKLDIKNQRAHYGGKRALLTEKETLLLALLLKNKDKTVSDAEIVEKVWKGNVTESSNIAAVYVNYLRKKLEEAFEIRVIFRVRGQGYVLKQSERKL